MENGYGNFIYLLQVIYLLVSEYFTTVRVLFGHTITLFFRVIDKQVSAYFTVFNNLFIASLDTVRYLVNGHFKLVNRLMVKNKTQNIMILSSTVIILHLNHYLLPMILQHYFQHHHYHLHFPLNQTDPILTPIPNCLASHNSQFPYLHHQPLLLY
jgi:hypothetical protein